MSTSELQTPAQLNTEFGIKDQLVFRTHENGLIIADISNAQAAGSVVLQGAHLLSWQPLSESAPVLWLSKDAKFLPDKSIRGGVPVCWPWFGAHPFETTFPAHGFARVQPWQVIESGIESSGPYAGATRLTLSLVFSEKTAAYWSAPCRLILKIVLGVHLHMALTTENLGASDITLSEALHTYFQISDISNVNVTGLEGADYWDTVGELALKTQKGAITFAQETDRVYIDSLATCVIEDRPLKRQIHIAKQGSQSTVVWTPWTAKAERMGDLGQPDGWREMLCIESANAFDNLVKVTPSSSHTLSVDYHVTPMAS